MQILFAGDVMLGRLVNKVLANAQFTYVWGDTIDIIKRADFSLINLECPVSSKGKEWNKTFKVFHFRANLDAIQVLNSASIDYVSLANNHILDYDIEALLDTLDILDKNNISHSGAGRNLKEAMKPAIIEKKLKLKPSNNHDSYYNVHNEEVNNNGSKNTIRIGLISLTDNEPEWEAKYDQAGINYIPTALDPDIYYYRLQNYIENAKKQSDLVIVSSHVGPHFRETPSMKYVNFAHKIIDLGADIYWGHSNHMPQGIELYKHNDNNKIILYDCGDFIDDYAIDSNYRNDLSFIFLLHFLMDKNHKLSNNNSNNGNILLQNSMIELIPTKISNFMVNTIPVDDNDADLIIKRMAKRCSSLGTKYFIDEKKKRIKIFLK
jgi:poly-gamma-glutamate capsule biosynthesis protein CapA/YwtB (metallophosphatase superfamily)